MTNRTPAELVDALRRLGHVRDELLELALHLGRDAMAACALHGHDDAEAMQELEEIRERISDILARLAVGVAPKH